MLTSKQTGLRIKAARKRLNMKQCTLADKAGVTRQTVHRYELGDFYHVKPTILQRLADALLVTPEYLLGTGTLADQESTTDPTAQSEITADPILPPTDKIAVTLTQDEAMCIQLFRLVPEAQRDTMLLLMGDLVDVVLACDDVTAIKSERVTTADSMATGTDSVTTGSDNDRPVQQEQV